MTESQVLAPEGQNYFQIIRAFNAPRTLIWRCYTQPEHMAHFWGPRDATTRSRIDLKPGGVWRTDWRYESGGDYGYTSVYLELTPPDRIVYRDAPDDWMGGLEGLPPGQLHSTIALSESGGKTTVTVTVRCTSIAARDENVKRGFAGMVSTGNDRLEEYLMILDPAQA